MRLKSRNQFPPIKNGFQYYDAAMGFWTTAHMPFDFTVREIIKKRQANPRFALATDYETVAMEVEQQVAGRLMRVPGGAKHVIDEGSPPVFPPRLNAPGQVKGAAGAVSKLLVGAKTIKDWLGHGMKPVSLELAERRASVCVGCEFNQPGDALEAIGDTTLKLIQAVKGLNMETSKHEQLRSCRICSCTLGLKIVVPLEHILKEQPDDVSKALPAHCWIKTESANEQEKRSGATQQPERTAPQASAQQV